jgi:myo-inositol-1(or 4)-monophosphatase
MAGAKGKRRRMHCASCRELNNAIVLTGLPHNRREILQPLLDTLGHMIQNTHGILRLGSAAIDLSWVACGRGACFYEPHLMPWDFAAGALLVREAGGLSTNFEGKPLTIEDRQVFCSAPHVHKNLLRLIRKTWN